MTELERFTAEAAKAVEELAGLRDQDLADPAKVRAALTRCLILTGSMALWLRCQAGDVLPPAACE